MEKYAQRISRWRRQREILCESEYSLGSIRIRTLLSSQLANITALVVYEKILLAFQVILKELKLNK